MNFKQFLVLCCGATVISVTFGVYYNFKVSEDTKPPVYNGSFFNFKVDVVYKGEPLTIEYPVGCNFNISRNIDGSRSVDGASITPSVFGVKTKDNGALVVKTPNFCNFKYEIDKGEVPSNYNPLIVHYANADEPTFGMGYYDRVSFDSTLSVLKFTSSNIKRIKGEEFVEWRDRNPNANWVTYDLMNAGPNIFKRREWLPGARHLATECRYSIFSPIPAEYEEQVNATWNNLNNPYFWTTEKFMVHLPKKVNSKWFISGATIYPSETDYDMNSIGEDGRIHPKKTTISENVFYEKNIETGEEKRLEKVAIRANIIKDEKLKGFAFCNSHDWNHPSGISMKRAFEEYRAGIHQLNGIELKEDDGQASWWSTGIHAQFYENNKSIIFNRTISFYGLGDRL